jgi:membrane protease YdiL (CAAX protease family)
VTSELVDDLLYNFVLVSPAEESMKLAGMLAIYRLWRNEYVSVGLPVGFWAVLHAYHAYIGSLQAIFVISAFASGLILYAVLKLTGSLENAIVSHAIYNGIVVLLAYV